MKELITPLMRRISNLLSRGTVISVNAASKMQTLQIRLLAGETKDGVEYFEHFGFTSKALKGAEHITASLEGDRSHTITLLVSDRRYRLTTLADGEVAMYDINGNKAHFKSDGTLAIVASNKVDIQSPLVTISGNLQVNGTISGASSITAPNIVGTTDVTFGGKAASTHKHSGVSTGAGNTGNPI